MTLQVGSDLGPYRITEELGSGGMATVYKAYQAKLDRYVAIKIMHELFAYNPTFLTRFEREARIIARLDHPNIVPVYDYDLHDKRPYLVMKYVEGVTLKDLVERSTLTLQETYEILNPIAEALHYAHNQGVLHRDVKPSNIVIDRRGTAYLTDFGLARLAQAGESTMSRDAMLGTPHYIAPEQAQGYELDARADVYSLGVILYQLVTGQVPFTADSSYAIIFNHIHTPPPPPREINPNLSPAVEAVLLKALAKNPDERYSTPIEMMTAFRQAIGVNQPARSAPQIAAVPPITAEPPHQETTPSTKPTRPDDLGAAININLENLGQELGRIGQEIGEKFRQWGESWEEPDKKQHKTRGSRRSVSVPDDDPAAIEARIRQRVEKRVKKRQEETQGLIIHLAIFFFVNAFIFHWNADFITFLWGIGLVSHIWDYYNKFGPGRSRQERAIEREMEREHERLYASGQLEKAKRDLQDYRVEDQDDVPRVRLTRDGEFTDSFIEDIEQHERRKK